MIFNFLTLVGKILKLNV